MRQLNVFFNTFLVGILKEENDLWQFQYAEAWCDYPDAFDLSPALQRTQGLIRDGASDRPVQWYFDNLLPEERLRDIVAREANIPWEDSFGLLSHYGAESAGALVLLPPDVDNALPTGKNRLTYEALSQRIRSLPQASLQRDSPKRMSLAGAQHKMLVLVEGEAIYEPEAGTPSTHILKPDHPDQDGYPASVLNEYFTMRLAGELGLDVPPVKLLCVPEPVYIVERFDRQRGAQESIERVHVIDTCQLLNRARTFKYSGANIESLQRSISRCRSKVAARRNVFRWLIFNVLTGNSDNHLKNLSYIVDQEGIRLAPGYDLLATSVYDTLSIADDRARWPNTELALQISTAHRTFAQLTREDVLDAGETIGLARKTVERELDRQLDAVLPSADRLLEEIEAEYSHLATQSPDPEMARRHWGIQEKVLRSIRHIIIKDMHGRLS